MRRDYFSLQVRNVAWADNEGDPKRPTLIIDFEGPTDPLYDRLTDSEGDLLDADEVDVTYRLQDPVDFSDARGVVGVTHRLTGDFIFELNESVENVFKFIRAARQYEELSTDNECQYAIELQTDGEHVATFQKQTLLVYNEEGELLREHSLIPSGVEL